MNQNYGDADSFDWLDGINEMEYLSTLDTKKNKSKNKIAVINVEGAITTGNISFDIAGSDSIVNNIRTVFVMMIMLLGLYYGLIVQEEMFMLRK